LTERELSEYESALVATGGNGLRKARLEDAGRRLIILCLVDQEGNRILNETHNKLIAEWDSADSRFLYGECALHCGMKTEEIENLVKNSEKANVVA
jgi:quinolinate synthase